MALRLLRRFVTLESGGGILLFVAAMLALVLDNSPLSGFYQSLFNTPLEIQLGSYAFAQPFVVWINDGLMAIFFLLVGLELKREFIQGELAEFKRILLPGFAALGGMIVPAIIFTLINWQHPEILKGWSIPVATDIAFALGVLALFGKRVPLGLKLFVMALAIFDDVGAIFIIAVSHTLTLSLLSLLLAAVIIFILACLNYFKVRALILYLFFGILLWVCVLKSGVHATIAGVILALLIPARVDSEPALRLENFLHPWVVYLIMPLFAFANAGVSFSGLTMDVVFGNLTLGIIAGLFIGKQLGVFSFTWIAIRAGWAKLPEKTTWLQIYAVAIICGIGFTMSLFLGTLAFELDNPIYLIQVRLGVLLGSVLSGMVGALILYHAIKKRGRKLGTS